MGAMASALFCFKSRDGSPTSEPAPSGASIAGDVPAEVPGDLVPAYVEPPPAPTTVDTAVSVVKEVLETMRDASDTFTPLKTALGLVLKVWDVYDRTTEVRDDFIEFAGKLGALGAIVTPNKPLDEANLQERLEAIAIAINQLAEAMQTKQDRGALSKASQSMGDVNVVKIMFRRVIVLLEVFQFEAQMRSETLLLQILERLNTPEQQDVTRVDAVQIILAHMDEQHNTNEKRYQAILNRLSRGRVVGGNKEAMKNNNSNQNELDGPADLENNNANETELEIEGRGGGIVNNNSNVNRVTGGGASSSGSGSPGGDGTRTRITNNNGNKNVVRRSVGAQKAKPTWTAGQ